MMPLRALIVAFVFVSFLQDSFEADFTSVLDLKAASYSLYRVSVERRAICESLCRSKRQDTTRFEKVRKDTVLKLECCIFNVHFTLVTCFTGTFVPLLYSIDILRPYFFIRQNKVHTRTLRSHAENEIFNSLNIFDLSAVSILYLTMVMVLCSSHCDARGVDCSFEL